MCIAFDAQCDRGRDERTKTLMNVYLHASRIRSGSTCHASKPFAYRAAHGGDAEVERSHEALERGDIATGDVVLPNRSIVCFNHRITQSERLIRFSR